MAKVVILRACLSGGPSGGQRLEAGAKLELPDGVAQELIAAGRARLASPPRKPPRLSAKSGPWWQR